MRGLREFKAMNREIERRDQLLQVVNQAADMLLRSEPECFMDTLHNCMELMARAINADHMYIYKNQTRDGKLYRAKVYEWAADSCVIRGSDEISYDETPRVWEVLSHGGYVHSLVRDLSPSGRAWFGTQGVLAVLLVPVFIEDEFWGFVGFDNCKRERLFTETEESIMRSGSMLVANALLRNEDTHRIREASIKLAEALAEAEAANNAKSDFLAHMSHEIRTPLNVVVGLSELVLDSNGLSGESADRLEKIHDSGMTILSIVNDILDISKIESGKFVLNPILYDIPSLINDAVTLNTVRIGEKDITFRLLVDENLPSSLYGDDLRVKQVFNNLLSNAIKYTHSGFVEWRVGFERDGKDIWLISSVSDTGIGIKPEDLDKLFSDYNQVDTGRNRRLEGTGLGLAISKRIAGMMDGSISVESEYGKGSTFTVRLRQKAASDSAIGPEIAKKLMDMRYTLAKRERGTKLKRANLSYAHVLVVDDIPSNLEVVKGMLKPYSLKIDCASSGAQAIEMIQFGVPRYGAVFMDHMMPGMDGVEAVRIIREIDCDYARNIPVIALTANAIVGNEEMFLSHGFQDFISKPIDMMKLDFVLRRWVRDKALEKEIWAEEENPAADGDGARTETSAEPSALRIGGLDTGEALERFGGDEDILSDVLRSYANNTPPLLLRLGEYLEAGRIEDYAIAVHGIKGASYGIAAREVGKEAEKLEKAAKAGDIESVKAGHPRFYGLAESLVKNIWDALDLFESAADTRPLAKEPDKALLDELRNACGAFDMDKVDSAMERLESMRYEKKYNVVAWLRERVDGMDFETIISGEWMNNC